jgi:Flp pilus assembly protein TadD
MLVYAVLSCLGRSDEAEVVFERGAFALEPPSAKITTNYAVFLSKVRGDNLRCGP